jgi:hypothetical protein
MKTVLPRENAVLKYLLRGLEDEKIWSDSKLFG